MAIPFPTYYLLSNILYKYILVNGVLTNKILYCNIFPWEKYRLQSWDTGVNAADMNGFQGILTRSPAYAPNARAHIGIVRERLQ